MSQWKAFGEVTALALVMFVVPVGYYYSRNTLLGYQERAYNRMFTISPEQYETAKKLQEEALRKEREASLL